jgi:hypothetical protein
MTKKKVSNEATNHASCQTDVSRGICYGRTHEMVLEIKKALEERGECGVGLMKDATDILKRLKDLGVNARAEPTYRTMPPMIKRNETNFVLIIKN